jgi:hypothetical protein
MNAPAPPAVVPWNLASNSVNSAPSNAEKNKTGALRFQEGHTSAIKTKPTLDFIVVYMGLK